MQIAVVTLTSGVDLSQNKGVGSGSVSSSRQTVSGTSKISVTFHLIDTGFSSFMMWNLQSYPTIVLNERVWHFMGSKYTLTLPTYFQGVRTLNTHDLRPWSPPYGWLPSLQKPEIEFITGIILHVSTGECSTELCDQPLSSCCSHCITWLLAVTCHVYVWSHSIVQHCGGPNASRRHHRRRSSGAWGG